jgi:hypothetical protein
LRLIRNKSRPCASKIVNPQGGVNMVYGMGRGFGVRGGAGFGFRGSSPPYPYIGRGRGGLPRCAYPGLSRTMFPYNAGVPFAGAPAPGEELDFLKSQAEATRQQLEEIESRIQELEKNKARGKE